MRRAGIEDWEAAGCGITGVKQERECKSILLFFPGGQWVEKSLQQNFKDKAVLILTIFLSLSVSTSLF